VQHTAIAVHRRRDEGQMEEEDGGRREERGKVEEKRTGKRMREGSGRDKGRKGEEKVVQSLVD